MSNSNENMAYQQKWHRIFGQVNFKYLEILCKDQLIYGVPDSVL